MSEKRTCKKEPRDTDGSSLHSLVTSLVEFVRVQAAVLPLWSIFWCAWDTVSVGFSCRFLDDKLDLHRGSRGHFGSSFSGLLRRICGYGCPFRDVSRRLTPCRPRC